MFPTEAYLITALVLFVCAVLLEGVWFTVDNVERFMFCVLVFVCVMGTFLITCEVAWLQRIVE